MKHYYNEFDPTAAAWLRALIADGLLPAGDVDERSIADVQPSDLAGYVQCHFFAGIGGWSLALRLADVPDSAPIWTGSCPCQPYSQAGKRRGAEDARDLWPVFFRLIEACRPPLVFGEQVASADVIGKARPHPAKHAPKVWLDRVFADLESAHYTCGAADLPAAGVNAPHIRQRLYWMGHTQRLGLEGQPWRRTSDQPADSDVAADGLAHPGHQPARRPAGSPETESGRPHCDSAGRGHFSAGCACGMAHASSDAGSEHERESRGRLWRGPKAHYPAERGSHFNHWSDFALVPCGDGKTRRIGTGIFPLADGLSYRLDGRRNGRAALLKGAGNAIVPQLAAEFIRAAFRSITDL